jgi:hypothetical protein
MTNTMIAGAMLVVAATAVIGLLRDEWRGRILGRRVAEAGRSRAPAPVVRVSIRL